MVFDIRGRRKHVVKVVYAVLAVLMGASLFLVVGPVNIGNLLGNQTGGGNAAAPYEEQAARIEHRLKKSPEDPAELLALTRARINAGNQLSERTSEGVLQVKPEGREQLELASESWSEYLAATDRPNPIAAQQMAQTLFELARFANGNEAEANVRAAAEAQKIAAEAKPSLNSLSTLAIFTMFTFDFAAANRAGKEAIKFAHTKFERENFENKLEEIEARAKEFQKQLTELKKASKGSGKKSIENPLSGGLTGSPGLGE